MIRTHRAVARRRFAICLMAAVALPACAAAPRPAAPGAGTPMAAAADPATWAGRLDAVFSSWAVGDRPGCAVGVALSGRPVDTRAYGFADLEHAARNTPETIFEAGSVSKQFTAAAILLLAQDGRLSLDDLVRKHVPELPDYGTPLTIRHLLHHTSGLRDWGELAALAGWPRTTRVHTQAHVLDILSRQRALNFTPGTEHSYCNSGYNLAAIIVSRVSGQSFAEFTRQRLFAPLGMTRTSWRDDHTRIVRGRATAYAVTPAGYQILMPFEDVHGNGGLLTTVGDLLTWNRNLATGTVGGAALLTALHERGRLTSGRDLEYAMGLYVTSWRGLREVSHAGATAGYRAFLARYPDRDVDVAVLCNASDADAAGLAHEVTAIALGGVAAEGTGPGLALPRVQIETYAGLYRNVVTGEATTIVVEGDALRLGRGPALTALGPSTFRVGSGPAMIEFPVSEDGAVRARLGVRGGESLVLERVPRAAPAAEALAALAGTYRSDEVEASYEVAVADGTLVLKRRPDRAWPLEPLYEDAFSAPIGLVRFVRGSQQAVTALTLTTGRVRALPFARVGP